MTKISIRFFNDREVRAVWDLYHGACEVLEVTDGGDLAADAAWRTAMPKADFLPSLMHYPAHTSSISYKHNVPHRTQKVLGEQAAWRPEASAARRA